MQDSLSFLYINGQFVEDTKPVLSHKDRGFLLGDGIFETMQANNGKVAFLEEHWERMSNSLKFFNIPNPLNFDELQSIIKTLLNINKLENLDASIRLTITRGIAPRGVLPPKEPNPTVLLVIFPLAVSAKKPVKLVSSTIIRNEKSPSTYHKTLNYLDSILARQQAAKLHADDAVFFSSQGYVAETTAANLFIVKNQSVITPKLSDGALPGIIRANIIKLCQKNDITLLENSITIHDLLSADGAFITNSIIRLQQVESIDKHLYNSTSANQLIAKIHQLLQTHIVGFSYLF